MRVDRLRRMADFLEKELPAQTDKCMFDINQLAVEKLISEFEEKGGIALPKDYDCGSHGCIIGWTPVAFKGEASYEMDIWGRASVVCATTNKEQDYLYFGMVFYVLDRCESEYLFSPYCYFDEENFARDWDPSYQVLKARDDHEQILQRYKTDQAEAIFRLRRVAGHYESTGQHCGQDAIGEWIDTRKFLRQQEFKTAWLADHPEPIDAEQA